MGSICVEKLPHHTDGCNTNKGLQVFANTETGKVTGYCFSCCTFIDNPYGEERTIDEVEVPKTKTEEEVREGIAEAKGYPVIDVPSRKLRANDLGLFNVTVAVSEEDGKTPEAMYFPMEKGGIGVGFYVKTLSKPSYTWSLGDVKNCDPFGWSRALRSGAYRLIITEGFEDAISVDKIYRMMTKPSDVDWIPAVISLKNGVNSVKSLSLLSDKISRTFKEVVICFDDDEVGRKAAQEAMIILPQATSVTLPYKDANDCVVNGAVNAAYKKLRFEASKPKNTSIVISGPELHEEAGTPTPRGEFTWPWSTIDLALRGMRTKETVYFGAGVKMGKSEVVDTLAAHLIKVHDVPVFMAKPEQENKKTYKKVLGKMVGKQFDDPDVDFDRDAYDEAGKMVSNKLHQINLYQHMGWDSLKKDIITSVNYGARAVFIDPITNLTAGMNSGDANSFLTGVTRDLSAMAMDMNFVAFIFCHLKAPEGNISQDQRNKAYRDGRFYNLGNCPHERGGTVMSSQFTGSRAMMQSCNLMFGIEGNRDPELEDVTQNTRWITILEDREFGNSLSVPLYWNRSSTQFREI